MAERKGMGSIPDPYDARDHLLYTPEHLVVADEISAKAAAEQTKPSILPNLPPVYDQGGLGSCVANAALAALRYAYHKGFDHPYDQFNPSRLHTYYLGRTRTVPAEKGLANENDPKNSMDYRRFMDTGSHTRVVISSFNSPGVCDEKFWPYKTLEENAKFDVPNGTDDFVIKRGPPPNFEGPSEEIYVRDENNRIVGTKYIPNPVEPKNWAEVEYQARDYIPRAISFYRIVGPDFKMRESGDEKTFPLAWDVQGTPTIALLEKCLSDGYPFLFSVQLYKTANISRSQFHDDVFIRPPTNDSELKAYDGRHALLAVGFDAVKRLFYIQNSWGDDHPTKQSGGRFWMPYEWFETNKHTYDFWVIKCADTKVKGDPVVFNPAHWNIGNAQRGGMTFKPPGQQ